jgi:hypothetical protein
MKNTRPFTSFASRLHIWIDKHRFHYRHFHRARIRAKFDEWWIAKSIFLEKIGLVCRQFYVFTCKFTFELAASAQCLSAAQNRSVTGRKCDRDGSKLGGSK